MIDPAMFFARIVETVHALKLPPASGWLLANMIYDEKHQANDEDNHMTKGMIEALRRRGLVEYVTMDAEKGRVIQLTEQGEKIAVRMLGRDGLRVVS